MLKKLFIFFVLAFLSIIIAAKLATYYSKSQNIVVVSDHVVKPDTMTALEKEKTILKEGNIIVATDLNSFIRAVKPNTTIVLEMEAMELNENIVNMLQENQYFSLELIGSWTKNKTKNKTITIQNVDNLTIIGKSKSLEKTKIISPLADGMVLKFRNVKNLTLENLNLGHSSDVCSDGVLGLYDSTDILIKNTHLFGGTFGLELVNISNFNFEESIIHDLSRYTMSIRDSQNINFKSSQIKNIGSSRCGWKEGSIMVNNSKNLIFNDMKFLNQNENPHLFFLDEDSNAIVQNSVFINNSNQFLSNKTNTVIEDTNKFENNNFVEPSRLDSATVAASNMYYIYKSEGIPLFSDIPSDLTADTNIGQIGTIPYKEKIQLIKNDINQVTLKGIKGSWVYIIYGDKKGYVFDGFISDLPVPNNEDKEEGAKYYHKQLLQSNIKSKYINNTEGDNGHFIYTSIVIVPTCSSKNAFLLFKELYDLPAFVSFPSYNGNNILVQENPNKEELLWEEEFTTTFGKDKEIQSFQYYVRGNGGGDNHFIKKVGDCEWSLEENSIVD